nr:hypothetical protein HUO10_001137 [Paraburkholderia busanensis]
MDTFTFDENNLAIQAFLTFPPLSKDRPPQKSTDSASAARYLYGNGKMTGICFLQYTYFIDTANLDATTTTQSIEDNIKSKIQFLDHAQKSDITTKGWLCFTSDDAERNDQYYHDYSTLVDTTVSVANVTATSISNTLQFFLLPPIQKSGSVATEIYAFYVPSSDNAYVDSTAPSNPYSTYGTSTIQFNVTAPSAATEDFTMSDKFTSGSGYHDCTHIYYIDYSTSKKSSAVVPTLIQWDLKTRYADDQGSGKMVNMGLSGHSGIMSLYTQPGTSGVADVTILALNASASALWPDDGDYPPHGVAYTSAEPLDYLKGGSSTGPWRTDGMSRFFDLEFNPTGIAGVPLVVIFGGHFIKDYDDGGHDYGCTNSDFRYDHLYALDCFGTTLEIIIDNDSSDYWNHNQAIHACSVYWPS